MTDLVAWVVIVIICTVALAVLVDVLTRGPGGDHRKGWTWRGDDDDTPQTQ